MNSYADKNDVLIVHTIGINRDIEYTVRIDAVVMVNALLDFDFRKVFPILQYNSLVEHRIKLFTKLFYSHRHRKGNYCQNQADCR